MNVKVIVVTMVVMLATGSTYGQTKQIPAAKKRAPMARVPQDNGKLVAGMKAPVLSVEEWLSEVPDMKGKFIALDFWGPSCKPCIAGFPHINELHHKYKDQVVFIAATTDEDPGEVYSFSAGAPVEFYSMMQKAKAWEDYKIQGIPHMLLIDPAGIVRYSGNGFELSEVMLQDIIKKYGNK
ncbi:thiol-disulfide isomerase/thioredoxin [Pedobacter sp. AK017]|uniref:TlpA family protein disulfide reductase n=1 Tax=Pedobacter sp. AK017 TaxID=2723073 RepID=UPI001610438E|nr:thioredoxin-like domain-containing protein [Pedobacter sp. AK017]MBB5441177.1 thiol-disulfide isomerase/thioredoxin [Pedobacter sp. AK017]